MTRVSITDLKAQLSRYLREVRRGGEVQVLDRGVPVARITSLPSREAGDDEERRRRLIEAGIVRPGAGGLAALCDRPPLELETNLSAALREDRADRL